MIIKALKTFSDGVIAMHEGEIANVPDTKAQRFIAEGYAVEYTGEGGEIDLSAYAKKTEAETIAFDVAKNIDGIVISDGYIPLELTTKGEYVDYSSGKFTSLSGAYGTTIQVAEGEKYRITGTIKYRTTLYALMNGTDKVYIYPTQGSNTPETLVTDIVTVPAGVTELRASSFYTPLIIEKIVNGTRLRLPANTDYLHGKKWAVCGDSFTAGDFTSYVDREGKSGTDSDAYDPIKRMYKTYPWWIAKRNDMDISVLAVGGNDFTNVEGAVRPFSDANTSNYNYTQIPTDCDYVTLQFGLNETGLTTEQIGTKTDSDNTTLWGAYNVVLEDILTKNPTVKIGIIISDAWTTQNYHDALVEIAKYWGVPYLDLKDGVNVPMLINGRLSENSTVAQTLRNNGFRISNTNSHPNVKGHEYRSTIIENFLRSL